MALTNCLIALEIFTRKVVNMVETKKKDNGTVELS
jgi:hypothetical protein